MSSLIKYASVLALLALMGGNAVAAERMVVCEYFTSTT